MRSFKLSLSLDRGLRLGWLGCFQKNAELLPAICFVRRDSSAGERRREQTLQCVQIDRYGV